MSDPYSNDDMTGGGSYLPSLPKLYQNIFNSLGFAPNPGPGPVHKELDMRNYFRKFGTTPAQTVRPAAVAPNPYITDTFTARPQAVAPNPYPTDNFPERPQTVAPNPYTTDNFPDRPTYVGDNTAPITRDMVPSTGRAHIQAPPALLYPGRQDYYAPYTSVVMGDVPNATYAEAQKQRPSEIYGTGPTRRGMMPRDPEEAGSETYNGPPTRGSSLKVPVIPKKTANVDLPASKEAEDTGEFLNNDPNDMRPGSLGEAQKLFPGRPLQQAIYYTEPEHGGNGGGGGMRRLGVGADTKGLNPDYIARIWEPADMSGGEKFIRGAYETPGKNPITWSPHKAEGGSIDAAHKIANQKATPCHVGFINAAVGGRTDHLPMHVLEDSYVMPAAEVGALGQGNSLAGAKILDNMFGHEEHHKKNPKHVAHKAVGGSSTVMPSNKDSYLKGAYTLPGAARLNVNGPGFAGTGIINEGFKTGPFGTSQRGAQFSQLKTAPMPSDIESLSERLRQNRAGTPAPQAEKRGGPVMSGNHRPVPIVAAGGEYVVHPEIVRHLGGGNVQKGHDYLDNFVKYVREHTIKTLKNLPGPRRD